jgi:phosphonate transport system substrate-binding protein
VGIVPQVPPREIVSSGSPVLRQVGQRSGQCLVLVVAPSIPAFEQQLSSGQLDFAFLNPYHQLMAQRWRGFIPLVRDGQSQLEGILVVRKDSPVRRLADLNGATVAFRHPTPSPSRCCHGPCSAALAFASPPVTCAPTPTCIAP